MARTTVPPVLLVYPSTDKRVASPQPLITPQRFLNQKLSKWKTTLTLRKSNKFSGKQGSSVRKKPHKKIIRGCATLFDIVHEYAYHKSRMGHGHRACIELTKAEKKLASVQTKKLDLEAQVKRLEEQVTAEKEKFFQILKASGAEDAQRHSEEVVGLRGWIAELEVEVKHVSDDFVVTTKSNFANYAWAVFYKAEKEKLVENLPMLIHEKFPVILEVELKLDGNVAEKVLVKKVKRLVKGYDWKQGLGVKVSKCHVNVVDCNG
ncbi:hypothetical protein Tco_0676041 [Tanacetum coccineum]